MSKWEKLPITNSKDEPIKRVYVEMVRDVVLEDVPYEEP